MLEEFRMKNLVVTDEQIMCAQKMYPRFKALSGSKKGYSNVLIAGDNCFLRDYFSFAVNKANEKYPAFASVTHEGDSVKNNSLVFFFADCNISDNMTATTESLKTLLASAKGSRVVVSVILPEFSSYSDLSEATSLAERELSFYLEKQCDKSEGIKYYLQIEKICRESVSGSSANVTLLRFANVFAPDFYKNNSLNIASVVESSVENKSITITDEDYINVYSVSYVRDACSDILFAAFKAKAGHVYNMSSAEITMGDIKEQIYSSYSGAFALEKTLSPSLNHRYHSLNTLKFDSLGNENTFDLSVMVRHIVSYISGYEYDTSDNVAFYSGRIKQIQAVEIEMLKEIDRICVKNDIKYFLAGGSLLGAVRSGGNIPWDDDLDIGMLREDYEKFRKACKTELSPQYSYSGPFNGCGSHYTTEKVRLDPTYFSTRYSSANTFPDGIFIDILVYDKTSNIKAFQRLHTFILGILYNCVILRWNHLPWAKKRHGIVKLIVPVLKLFPWGMYHHLFDFFAKIYKNKKNAKFLIDTVGKKLKDGPLPIDGLEDTVYVDFEDIKAPVPVDCTGYLNYAYGANYMEKPNLSNRCCPHNFARIDLGKFVFDKNGSTPFKSVNVKGELFESETEI